MSLIISFGIIYQHGSEKLVDTNLHLTAPEIIYFFHFPFALSFLAVKLYQKVYQRNFYIEILFREQHDFSLCNFLSVKWWLKSFATAFPTCSH